MESCRAVSPTAWEQGNTLSVLYVVSDAENGFNSQFHSSSLSQPHARVTTLDLTFQILSILEWVTQKESSDNRAVLSMIR